MFHVTKSSITIDKQITITIFVLLLMEILMNNVDHVFCLFGFFSFLFFFKFFMYVPYLLLIIEGYCKDPFRKDRNNSGGGVIVYFSNHLIVQPRTDLNFDSEAIWLEIVFPAYKMLLCVVYRQLNANYPFWDKFQQSVENATNYSSNVAITGDLNVDFLSEHSHKLFDIMRLNDLKKHDY